MKYGLSDRALLVGVLKESILDKRVGCETKMSGLECPLSTY